MPKDPDIIEMVQDEDGTYVIDTRSRGKKKNKAIKASHRYEPDYYDYEDETITTGIPNIDNFLNGFEIGNHIFERFENILRKGYR